jgi:hypothetical protein
MRTIGGLHAEFHAANESPSPVETDSYNRARIGRGMSEFIR